MYMLLNCSSHLLEYNFLGTGGKKDGVGVGRGGGGGRGKGNECGVLLGSSLVIYLFYILFCTITCLLHFCQS